MLARVDADAPHFTSYRKGTASPTLSLPVSAPIPPSRTELLQSEPMTILLEHLAKNVDAVVVDTPPVLAAKVEGVIFVANNGHVRIGRVTEALERMQRAGTRE